MPLPAGIGARFELRGALGAGSMGVVLRAFDRELGREVALKTLPDRGLEETLHLKAEFRLLANVLHPNLVELFELFSGDEHCFFTMELLAGVTFDQHLAAAVDIDARVARVVAALPQLVSGIATLHAADTLHCDIKPSNIMVDGARVVLLDFGLAQRLWGADQAAESGGTWDYMAPEAVWGRAGPAADWYSLG
ncbi:MAG: serine/threonine protein kinase, partial [Nannocystis sp.]